MGWNIVYRPLTGGNGTITSGIVFPSNGDAVGTTRFDFTGSALPPIAPATVLLKAYPIQHTSYYTFFFFGTNSASLPSGGENYWGCHPYPDGGAGGTTHKWEVAVDFNDFVVDDNANDTAVVKSQWYSQASSAETVTGTSTIRYYWNLVAGSNRIITRVLNSGALTADSSPALMFGDAPWNADDERASARIRGIQVYNARLSLANIEALQAMEDDAAVLAKCSQLGISSLWYLNMNPTPSDITDKSGNGHDPAWINANHGTLWTP